MLAAVPRVACWGAQILSHFIDFSVTILAC